MTEGGHARAGPPDLRVAVADLNRGLHAAGLVTLAFGNGSVVDRDGRVVAIKPSGVPCQAVEPDDVVLVELEDGATTGGRLAPSSDLATHLVLYRAFPTIGAIVHTHSPYATAWAQARRPIPCYGTTHADYFAGSIPVTRPLTSPEAASGYTESTGAVVAELFGPDRLDPDEVPGALVAGHGPFVWGRDANAALTHAVVLEQVAMTALLSLEVDGSCSPLESWIRDRHFARKHGPDATYGQRPIAR